MEEGNKVKKKKTVEIKAAQSKQVGVAVEF